MPIKDVLALVIATAGLLAGPAGFRPAEQSADAALVTEVKELLASDAQEFDWAVTQLSSDPSRSDASAAPPALALGPDGSVAAAWQEEGSPGQRIFVAEYTSGQWTSPVAVSDVETSTTLAYPSLTYDSDGGLHAAWGRGGSGFIGELLYAQRPAGQGWSSPTVIHVDTQIGSRYNVPKPLLRGGPRSTVHLIWRGYRVHGTTGVFSFYHSSKVGTGPWPGEPEQGVPDNGYAEDWDYLVNPDGTLELAIAGQVGFRSRDIFYTRFDGIEWSPLIDVSLTTGDYLRSRRPSLVRNPNAELEVIWDEDVGTEHEVRWSKLIGAGWTRPEAVPGTTLNSFVSPAAIGTDEAVFLVYSDSGEPNSGRQVWQDANGTWGDSAAAPLEAASPHGIGATANGTVHVLWTEACGGGCDVMHGVTGSKPPPISVDDRLIVYIQGIDSRSSCNGTGFAMDGAPFWLEPYLETQKWLRVNLDVNAYHYFSYRESSDCGLPSEIHYEVEDTCDGVVKAAGELWNLINSKTTAKVSVVAHSMGGLVAAYIVAEQPIWAKAHIASVVTFDSPLHGVPWLNVKSLAGASSCDLFASPPHYSLTDLYEGSDVVRCALGTTDTCAEGGAGLVVPFYTIDAGADDIFVVEFVPEDSTKIDGSARHLSDADNNHRGVWDNPTDEKKEFVACAVLAYWPCILILPTVYQGATTSSPMTVGPSADTVRFTSTFGSIVRMTLRAPNGSVYGPNGTGSVSAYGADATSETYVIENPIPGTWSVELEGIEIDPGGEEVLVALLVEEISEAGAPVGGIVSLPEVSAKEVRDEAMSGSTYATHIAWGVPLVSALLALIVGACLVRVRQRK